VNKEGHSDSSWFRPLLVGKSPTSSGLILKMNMCYKRSAECSRSSRAKGGNGSRTPFIKVRGAFKTTQGLLIMVDYFITQVKLHGQWCPRLETLVHRDRTRLLGRSFWLLGT
jgi:hypothetical protein